MHPRRNDIHRHTWKWVAGCILAAAALGWFLYSRLSAQRFDWALAARGFAGLDWRWLVVSLIPICGSYVVRALRWAVFLRPLKPNPSIAGLISATAIGFAAITLFGRPGEFVRPYLISRKERVPVASQLAAWLLERLFDLLMALLFFAFALTRVQASAVHVGPGIAWVLATGGRVVAGLSVAILLTLLTMRHFAQPLQRWLLRVVRFLPERQFNKIEKLVEAAVQGVESTRSDAALLAVFGYSVVEWLFIAACFWCLAQAFSGLFAMRLVDVLIFMGFVAFGSAVQVPGIGGGVQIVSALVLTELFGVRLELATSFSFVVWFFTFVVIVPPGLILAIKEGLDWRTLRRIGQETPTK